MTGEQALKEQFSDTGVGDCPDEVIVSASKDLERFAVLVARMDGFPEDPEEKQSSKNTKKP